MNIDLEPAQTGVSLAALGSWMDSKGLGNGAVGDPVQLTGGTQNLLFLFERAGRRYVLRRPALKARPGADALMLREARVLEALSGSAVPHPQLVAACDDPQIIGSTFYLMEAVDGFNATTELPPSHTDPAAQHAMGLALVDGISALGAIDHLAVGLETFGRPEGFLERQVSRWAKEIEGYARVPDWPGQATLPSIDVLQGWLTRHQPSGFSPGIMHGDYHIGNVMYRWDQPALAAIIDWELSTIGDPLLDLAWLVATWPDASGKSVSPTLDVSPWVGFPSAAELVERYRERSSRDLSAIDWYVVLACYKLGIILEGTHVRAHEGKADLAMGKVFHQAAINLFERANKIIR